MLKLCIFTIFCENMDVIVSLWCEVTWPSRPYWFELAGQETWSKPCLPCPLWYFGLLALLIYFIIFPTKFWHRDEDSVTLQQGALEELSQHILSAHRDSASLLCWLRRETFLFVSFLRWKLNWNDHHTLTNDIMTLILFTVQRNSNYV